MFCINNSNFDTIANLLLNKCVLVINNSAWRIVEIEFYYYSETHKDDYTHKDNNQKKNGEWYFHRQNGKSYKGGSYKGLDISCGDGNNYGGILIRSIEKNDELIEGPCKVVNKILELTSCPDIISLVDKISLNILEPDLLYIKEINMDEQVIMKGPRVGLTFKKTKSFEYIYRDYRYLTSTQIKKNKCTIVLSEYARKKDIQHWGKTNINKWISFYNKGKDKNEKYFMDNPSISTVELQCELFGYVTKN